MVKTPKINKKDDKLANQLKEVSADLLRVQADFTNYRRRAEEDKQRSIRFGRETAVMALLGVIDNIERALGHIPYELTKNEWAIGVKSVVKQLDDSLRGIGVEKIVSIGQEFDPNLHEAIHLEDGKGKKEIVIEELQPGYSMDGEVIRHAMVKVGRK